MKACVLLWGRGDSEAGVAVWGSDSRSWCLAVWGGVDSKAGVAVMGG